MKSSNTQKRNLIVTTFFLLLFAVPVQSQRGWVATQVAPADQDLNTVFFLDDKRGWVGGDKGYLTRTEDGGHSWVKQVVQTDDAINDIYFRDKEIGFLLAGNSIFVTRDNGNSWTKSRTFLPGSPLPSCPMMTHPMSG